MRKTLAASRCVLVLAGCLIGGLGPEPTRAVELFAGAFSFSDELGGFRLISARGSGTRTDPIVIVEEFEEAAPATLVIRRRVEGLGPLQPIYQPLILEKVVVNRSRRVWPGFELELQEILNRPSTYGDGLSFNQFGAGQADAGSDAYAHNEREFEPHDRILFQSGHVNPGATVRFTVTITDPTPRPEFYLVQDPKLLSAALPQDRDLAAIEALLHRTGDARILREVLR